MGSHGLSSSSGVEADLVGATLGQTRAHHGRQVEQRAEEVVGTEELEGGRYGALDVLARLHAQLDVARQVVDVQYPRMLEHVGRADALTRIEYQHAFDKILV